VVGILVTGAMEGVEGDFVEGLGVIIEVGAEVERLGVGVVETFGVGNAVAGADVGVVVAAIVGDPDVIARSLVGD
jgi:hypothetical protein